MKESKTIKYKWVKENPKEFIYYWCKEKGWSLKPHLEEHWVIREATND